MARPIVKRQSSPDERRDFKAHGHLDLFKFGDLSIGCATFEPGWKWSNDVKPIAGTDQCMAAHTSYCVSGHMRIRMEDGEEIEVGPGDTGIIPPGHDAWVLGNEPCVMLDIGGFEEYAKPHAEAEHPAEEHPPSMH